MFERSIAVNTNRMRILRGSLAKSERPSLPVLSSITDMYNLSVIWMFYFSFYVLVFNIHIQNMSKTALRFLFFVWQPVLQASSWTQYSDQRGRDLEYTFVTLKGIRREGLFLGILLLRKKILVLEQEK